MGRGGCEVPWRCGPTLSFLDTLELIAVLRRAPAIRLCAAKKKGSDLPERRPNRVQGLPLGATGALPIPNIAGKANTFVDVLADQRAVRTAARLDASVLVDTGYTCSASH